MDTIKREATFVRFEKSNLSLLWDGNNFIILDVAYTIPK